jgi:hypothetical protein
MSAGGDHACVVGPLLGAVANSAQLSSQRHCVGIVREAAAPGHDGLGRQVVQTSNTWTVLQHVMRRDRPRSRANGLLSSPGAGRLPKLPLQGVSPSD